MLSPAELPTFVLGLEGAAFILAIVRALLVLGLIRTLLVCRAEEDQRAGRVKLLWQYAAAGTAICLWPWLRHAAAPISLVPASTPALSATGATLFPGPTCSRLRTIGVLHEASLLIYSRATPLLPEVLPGP